MSQLAFSQPENQENTNPSDSTETNILRILDGLNTPELIIGLCGPIGSPINEVDANLSENLKKIGYEVIPIKLSTFISTHFSNLRKEKTYEKKYSASYLTENIAVFDKKKRFIEIGNCLREKYNSTFLAECAIKEIALKRGKDAEKEMETTSVEGDADEKNFLKNVSKGRRIAYIINSIKNQAEFELLRMVYRDIFYMIGVTSSIENRQTYLEEKGNMSKAEVWQLIDQETGEEIEYGQTVKDTFPQSDYLINVSSRNNEAIKEKVERFLILIFSANISIAIPTKEETAMYIAASAALNSACFSRQVGAVLTDSEGEVLSVGWNDVPVYGGGLYQNGKEISEKDSVFFPKRYSDERCFNHGKCFSDDEKNIMSDKITAILAEKKLISDKAKNDTEKIIRSSKINSIVEFSRSIHAEMHAIITGCISAGTRVKGGKLFITTYPCHMCARHIILAGIKEVYYIEPYKKSLTTRLHFDSIVDIAGDEDLKVHDKHKVFVKQFEGVGPARYVQLFKMLPNSRKEKLTGRMLINSDNMSKRQPKYTISLTAIPAIEAKVTKELQSKLDSETN